MSTVDAPLALPWVVFTLTWWLLSLSVAGAHALLRPRLAGIEPTQRGTLLLALAVLPPTVAALVALLGFAPSVGGRLVNGHCHDDVGCSAHVPVLQTGAGEALLLDSLLVGVTAVTLWLLFKACRRSLAAARMLSGFARPCGRESFRIIDTDELVACCVGLWRPQPLLSRGLVDSLTPQQLAAVVAHEQGHAARRDNLRRWIASICLRPLPRRARARLLADLALAGEQACDRIAAAATGGHRAVVEGLAALQPHAGACGRRASRPGTGDAISARIDALQRPARRVLPASGTAVAVVLIYWMLVVTASYAAHHGAETLLALTH